MHSHEPTSSRTGIRPRQRREASSDRLESCLEAERRAVDVYGQAIVRTDAQRFAWKLLHLMIVHQARAASIASHLATRGVVARPVRPGAGASHALGEGTLLAGLESLEDGVLTTYEDASTTDGSRTGRFLAALMAEQYRTRQTLVALVTRAAREGDVCGASA